jgi:hypothetical protein
MLQDYCSCLKRGLKSKLNMGTLTAIQFKIFVFPSPLKKKKKKKKKKFFNNKNFNCTGGFFFCCKIGVSNLGKNK